MGVWTVEGQEPGVRSRALVLATVIAVAMTVAGCTDDEPPKPERSYDPSPTALSIVAGSEQ